MRLSKWIGNLIYISLWPLTLSGITAGAETRHVYRIKEEALPMRNKMNSGFDVDRKATQVDGGD